MVTSHHTPRVYSKKTATARSPLFRWLSRLPLVYGRIIPVLFLSLWLTVRSVYAAPVDPLAATSVANSGPQLLNHDQCQSIVQQVFALSASEKSPGARWEKRFQLLKPYKSACYQHGDFLSVMGAAELNNHRLYDAQDTLERVLMLNPNHGDAMINYAQVLNLLGQTFAAYDLNQQLLKRKDLPPEVADFVTKRDQLWASRFSRTDMRLTTALAYDSNLNTAADLSSLTLGNGATLVLDEESQPVSGTVFNLNASVKRATALEDGMHLWQGNLYTRTGAEERLQQTRYRHDQQQLDLHYKRLYYSRGRHNQKKPTLAWGLTGRQFWYNGSSLYQSLDLQLEQRQPLEATWADCRIESEFRLSRQHYPGDRSQDALDHKLQSGLECQLTPQFMLYSQIGIAFNRALNDRTGGNRQIKDLVLAGQYREQKRLWSLSGRFAHTTDQTGYSAQLDNGNPRSQRSLQVTGQLRQTLTGDLALEFSLTRLVQKSNIVLFEYDAERASLALDWRF